LLIIRIHYFFLSHQPLMIESEKKNPLMIEREHINGTHMMHEKVKYQ